MKTDLKSIAKLANVSVSAVSLALNGKPGVGNDTRKKILQIEKELRNKVNEEYLANSKSEGTFLFLKLVKHGNILNRDHDIFIADYIEGIENEASKKGFGLQISTFDKELTPKNIKHLDELPVDGFIMLGTELTQSDVELLNTINKPKVFVDTFFDYVNASFVDMSSADEVFQAVKYLFDMGHTEIGYVRSKSRTQNFLRRDIGFHRALDYLNLEFRQDLVFSVESTFSGAYEDMTAFLKSGVKIPSALFIVNDLIASGCIKALKEFGLSIPSKVSIVGFDNLPSSAIMEPGLTSINVRKRWIGKKASDLLIEKIHSQEPTPPTKIVVSGELIIRDSVKRI